MSSVGFSSVYVGKEQHTKCMVEIQLFVQYGTCINKGEVLNQVTPNL